MIPESFIHDLIARADIVELVGRYVQLRKAGANYQGLCPFHDEKGPSFTVSPVKQIYHCFGCGVHGNAIGFLMAHTGETFPQVVSALAHQYGMQVPEVSRDPSHLEKQHAQRERLKGLQDVMATASQFYTQQLRQSELAISYLKQRGLTGETASRFGIGYAPKDWQALQSIFPEYNADIFLEAGLVIQGDTRRYDRFRDRIMFPIKNIRGEIIGFGGRVLDKSEPKYLNSPETPLFQKGSELYGLYEARTAIREKAYVLVVEGYMDVVALAQLGFPNAVATLGTATTAIHLQKLLRVTQEIVFSFDGDAAGQRAAWRALETCLPYAQDHVTFRFLFLPLDHDPDSFIREHGSPAFQEAIDRALTLSQLLLRQLKDQHDLNTPEGRARCLYEAQTMLQALPEGGLHLQLMHSLAEMTQTSITEITQLFEAKSSSDQRKGASSASVAETSNKFVGNANLSRGGARRTHGFDKNRNRPYNPMETSVPGSRRGVSSLARRITQLIVFKPELAAEIAHHPFKDWQSMPGMHILVKLMELIHQYSPSHSGDIIRVAENTPYLEDYRNIALEAAEHMQLIDVKRELQDALIALERSYIEQEQRTLVEAGEESAQAMAKLRALYQRLSVLKQGAMLK